MPLDSAVPPSLHAAYHFFKWPKKQNRTITPATLAQDIKAYYREEVYAHENKQQEFYEGE